MKKSLLSILALAVFVTGCQNYDDQFDSLNKQITALTAKVDGLNPATAADISAITGQLTTLAAAVETMKAQNATDLASILADLAKVTADLAALDTKVASDIAGVETSVASLTAQLSDVAANQLTDADAAGLTAVADLQAELDAIKAALDGLLSAGASLKRDIVISNSAELALAESLIDVTSTADYIIEGNVHIDTSTPANYTDGVADAITRISAMTAKLSTVLGTVTSTHASSSAALDMSKLTYVKTSLEITGKMPTLTALATTGALDIDTDDAVISIPTLVSAGVIGIDVSASVTLTSVNLSGVTSTDAATTGTNEFVAANADVNLGKAGLPTTVTVGALTGGGTAYTSGTISTTSGDINLSAATVSGSYILSMGNVTMSGGTSIGATTINAAGNITVAHAAVGSASVTFVAGSGNTITLSGATGMASATTLTVPGGVVNAPALKDVTTSLTVSAVTVDISAMTSNTGAMVLVGPTTLNLPAMTNIGGTITALQATTVNAGVLALTGAVSNAITTANDGTHSYKSYALTAGNTAGSVSTTSVAVLNLSAQAGDLDLTGTVSYTPSGASADTQKWARLTTLNITGAKAADPTSQSNAVTVNSANASLTTVAMVGDSWLSAFTSNNSPMTTLTTAGRIRAFTVSGTALTALTFGHVEVTPGDASSIDIINTLVPAVDMSASAIKTDYIHISDNASLTTITMPAETNLPEPSATISITIIDNALGGSWTAAVAATGTTPYVEGSFTSTGTGMKMARTYITALASQTGRSVAPAFAIEIDDATDAMTANQAASVILADTAIVHYQPILGSIAANQEVINTALELWFLEN